MQPSKANTSGQRDKVRSWGCGSLLIPGGLDVNVQPTLGWFGISPSQGPQPTLKVEFEILALYFGGVNEKDMQMWQQVKQAWKEHPDLVRFTIVGIFGYVVWYATYAYWLRPNTLLDEVVIHSMVLAGEWVMTSTGWEVIPPAQAGLRSSFGVAGSGGVWIADSCDGVVLFALFAMFMLAFPGRIHHKLWFIPVGVLLLHGANIARVVALAFLQWWRPEWVEFNHHYTFTVLIYGLVFGLWYWWAKSFVNGNPGVHE